MEEKYDRIKMPPKITNSNLQNPLKKRKLFQVDGPNIKNNDSDDFTVDLLQFDKP